MYRVLYMSYMAVSAVFFNSSAYPKKHSFYFKVKKSNSRTEEKSCTYVLSSSFFYRKRISLLLPFPFLFLTTEAGRETSDVQEKGTNKKRKGTLLLPTPPPKNRGRGGEGKGAGDTDFETPPFEKRRRGGSLETSLQAFPLF